MADVPESSQKTPMDPVPVVADQDTAMADAPNTNAPTTSTPTPTNARVSTPTGGRISTPQRNGPPAAGTQAPTQPALPAKAIPNGARCRQYLNENVTITLLEGMKRVASEQPEAPLKMLGEFLIAKSKELEGSS